MIKLVTNEFKFRELNALQFVNILVIFVTNEVLKFGNSNDTNSEQFVNI